ncbi:hypothetical protein NLI96_g13183 [Meripilus lineatus]|uniref:UBC core domain-containing protein n=1 Tax=Meripilus lineatus TaxID=2056292 RepID=A0AAD5UNJ7_9APHY|nr:hypothetical protein NLI96_g13183 [Physisporinus lineatus]
MTSLPRFPQVQSHGPVARVTMPQLRGSSVVLPLKSTPPTVYIGVSLPLDLICIMDARLRRVNKEIADCKNDKTSQIKVDLFDSSPFHLKGSFNGPEDTPYEGGHFEVVRLTRSP